jgi:hypothetical protein
VQANPAIRRDGNACAHGKRHIDFLLEHARLLQFVAFDFDRELLDRRVRTGKHHVVHEIRKAFRCHGDTRRLDVEQVGAQVVKGRRFARRPAHEVSRQIFHAELDLLVEMEDDIFHASGDAVVVRRT